MFLKGVDALDGFAGILDWCVGVKDGGACVLGNNEN